MIRGYSEENNKEKIVEKVVPDLIFLECDICMMAFDLENHIPLSLECGHAMCQTCYNGSKSKCSFCNQEKKATKFF